MVGKKVVQVDKRRLKEVCKQNSISFLGFFGSYARGDAKEESDLDVLVSFSQPKSLLDLVRIEDRLSAFFNKKVDLITDNSLSPYLVDEIKKDLEVVYSEKEEPVLS